MKHIKYWTIGIVVVIVIAIGGTIVFMNGNDSKNKDETEIAQESQENSDDKVDTTEEGEADTSEEATDTSEETTEEATDEQESDATTSDETNPNSSEETSADTDDDSEAIAAMTAEEKLEAYSEEEAAIMDTMMEGMENVPNTGDTALDFLYGMIPHHEAAIAMAESALKYGAVDEEVVKIAENVIRVQTQENEEMAQLIKDLEVNPNIDEKKEKKYLKEYNKMFGDSMSHGSSSHGFSSNDSMEPSSVDEAFTAGMITHHQMAIDMSEAILDYTDNTDIKEMAEGIVEVQKEEIKQMEALLERLK